METEATTPSSPFTDFTRRTFLGVIFTALVTAILTLLIAKALSHFVISPALCRGASQAVCQSSTEISFHIASLIAAIVGVAMLVNLSVYRPLLVMVAVVMGSWEVYATTSPLFALTLPSSHSSRFGGFYGLITWLSLLF
jgi:hypothetical protein